MCFVKNKFNKIFKGKNMNFKNILNNFIWKNESKYSFSLSESDKENVQYIENNELNIDNTISSSFDKNLTYIKAKYNSMINKDIVIREFDIIFQSKTFHSVIVGIE